MRRLRVARAALAAVALVAAGCGGGDDEPPTATTTVPAPPPASTATPAPAPKPQPVEPGVSSGLSIGLTETNANVIRAPDSGPDLPAFRPWQERVARLRPALYRLPIDWASLQPDPGKPANLALPADGCMRGAAPCAPFAGVRALLEAARTQQDAGNGFEVMVVFMGVPDWAAHGPAGCERPGIQPRSRPITARGVTAFRALVAQVAALAHEAHVDVPWWSAWNEPNGPFFISPQRARCSVDSPPVSTKVYTRLFGALKAELDALPGDQHLALGDLAGVAEGSSRGTGTGEFLRHLPDSVVCSADVMAQHAYAELPGQKTRPGDPIATTERALDARPCARGMPIWITETGVGGLHAGDERRTGRASLHAQCVAFNGQLRDWLHQPRIRAAFQYSFREDPVFPVGLADAQLTRDYPTYDLLRAWSNRARPDDPPPSLPDACS